jgi:integrase
VPLPRQGRKLPDAPSDEDVGKLLANAKGWLHTAIALSVYAGLRMGEARALEVCDVDFKRGQLMVRLALSADEVMPPKSGHERVVPLAPELRAVLETAVRLKMPHARVVVNERGVTPKRQRVLTALKRLESKSASASGPSTRCATTSAPRSSAATPVSRRCACSPGIPSSTSRNATCTPRETICVLRSLGSRATRRKRLPPRLSK